MIARQLRIPGAWLFTPTKHEDNRGSFAETFVQSRFTQIVGHPLVLKQANLSISKRGTLRGIHFADVPPGQAKYLQVYHGHILDAVVDIRAGSPTFGHWDLVDLTADSQDCLYIAEGLGHAFCVISETASVGYVCSEAYAPSREHTIFALDEVLGIPWPSNFPLELSPRDRQAVSLETALESGLLPDWETCNEHYSSLGDPVSFR